MASSKKFAMGAAGAAGAGEALNVEDVFSTYLYTGDSTSPRTITNGIDLSGEGGLVWFKSRTTTTFHGLFDTERGATKRLRSDSTNAEDTLASDLTAFNSDGFTLGNGGTTNTSPREYASWTFRKAPKFFDIQTWTGDGTSGRTISHDLGSTPGMVVVKSTSTSGTYWSTWHRSIGEKYLLLNETLAATNAGFTRTVSSTEYELGPNWADENQSGRTYVGYFFAHNDGDGEFGPTGDQDIIKCGSYTGNGSSTGPEIDLGFEPQWLLLKNTSTAGHHWHIYDVMRGWTNGGEEATLLANTSDSENGLTGAANYSAPTSTGFKIESASGEVNTNGNSYIYIAIRRGPMAVPTDSTDVFAIDTRGTTGPAFNAGFPIDAAFASITNISYDKIISTRLRASPSGPQVFKTNSSSAETTFGSMFYDYQEGYHGTTSANSNFYSWMWRRAPEFFDVVTYKGNNTNNREIKHNLGAEPEMMIFKNLSYTYDAPLLWNKWPYWNPSIPHNSIGFLYDMASTSASSLNHNTLNSSNATSSTPYVPTDTSFWVGQSRVSNRSGDQIMALLFASLSGVSKVGTYTGNSSNNSSGSQTIDCGFSNGAQFVLIKSLGTSQPWQLFDTTRGINAGTDNMLEVNSQNPNRTWYDWIDQDSSGFIVNNFGDSGYNLNTNNHIYIYYAVAA